MLCTHSVWAPGTLTPALGGRQCGRPIWQLRAPRQEEIQTCPGLSTSKRWSWTSNPGDLAPQPSSPPPLFSWRHSCHHHHHHFPRTWLSGLAVPRGRGHTRGAVSLATETEENSLDTCNTGWVTFTASEILSIFSKVWHCGESFHFFFFFWLTIQKDITRDNQK